MTTTTTTQFVRHANGQYYVQAPAANQWGFELLDSDQSYPGGFGLGAGAWQIVPRGDLPADVLEELGWIFDESEAN